MDPRLWLLPHVLWIPHPLSPPHSPHLSHSPTQQCPRATRHPACVRIAPRMAASPLWDCPSCLWYHHPRYSRQPFSAPWIFLFLVIFLFCFATCLHPLCFNFILGEISQLMKTIGAFSCSQHELKWLLRLLDSTDKKRVCGIPIFLFCLFSF